MRTQPTAPDQDVDAGALEHDGPPQIPSPRKWRRYLQGGAKQRLLGVLILLCLSATVLLPLVFLVAGSLSESGLPRPFTFTTDNWTEAFLDPGVYRLLGTSVLFAAGSLFISSAFAIPLAWVIERTDIGRKGLMRLLIIASSAVPGLFTAIAWTLLASPRIGFLNAYLPFTVNIYSFWGMCFVQGISIMPLTFLMLSPAMRNLDTSMEEAGSLSSRYPTVVRKITLGLLRPAMLAALIYIFILCLLSFDVPATIGIPADVYVLSSEIFFASGQLTVPRYGYTSAIALLSVAIGVILMIVYLRASVFEARYATVTGKLRGSRYRLRRGGRILAYFWFWLFIAASMILPVFALVWTSLTPFLQQIDITKIATLSLDNFSRILERPGIVNAARNTLLVSAISSTLAAFIAALISWFVVRSKVRWRKPIDVLAFLPLVIPGVVLGLSLRFTVLSVDFLPIYGTIWILVLAYWVDALPFATRTFNSGIVQIHSEMEEAATMHTGSFFTVFRTIVLPLIVPTVAFVWLWTFLRGLREFSSAALLSSPSNQVLSIALYSDYSNGQLTSAAALSVLMLLAILPISFVVLAWLDRSRSKAGML